MSGLDGQRAWQRMLSGRRLDLLDPSPLDVEMEDIAHGLARVARWNGQTTGDHAFSVAQHSLIVETAYAQLEPDCDATGRLYALLHDGPEYVIGDMISPFKAVMGGAYKDIEARLQAAIHMRAGLAGDMPERTRKLIKQADRIVAYFEATRLAGFGREEAAKYFTLPGTIKLDVSLFVPMATIEAQNRFLTRLQDIESTR